MTSQPRDNTHARTHHDYDITPENQALAAQRGLVSAQWQQCVVDRKLMKTLMKRSDRAALIDMALWLGSLCLAGVIACLTWGSLWCIPAFAVYGILWSASDHRAHELSHGTPFKTSWLNEVFYQISSFMTFHEAVFWRWSHARHHTDTLIVGSDREIAVPRPPSIASLLLDFFSLRFIPGEIRRTVQHAKGQISAETTTFVPVSEHRKMILVSRLYLAIWVATLVASVALWSWLPILLLLVPRFYGAPVSQFLNLTQHTGLAENVLDHRLNTRTVYMNPTLRFIYMNMNYHVEHHMFPMVPFHALPLLHEAIKDQCPPPYASPWSAWKEIIPAVLRQRKDPAYCVQRPLRSAAPQADAPLGGHPTA